MAYARYAGKALVQADILRRNERSVNELKINSHVTDESKAEVNIMLNQLEIN